MAEPRRFEVAGPFKVPVFGNTGQRSLDRAGLDLFWTSIPAGVSDDMGCYVFALRRGRGCIPIYVGKTVKQSFRKECFTDRYYRVLHEALLGQSGTLVVFLVRYERSRGAFNAKAVAELERFLVESALNRNPGLKNTVYTKTSPGFAIRAVHRSPGRPSKAAVTLKATLGLTGRH